MSTKSDYDRKRYYDNRKLVPCPNCGKQRYMSTLIPDYEKGLCFTCSVRKLRDARIIVDPEFSKWFWSMTKLKDSGCIEWGGNLRGENLKYGRVYVDREYKSTHRVAWMVSNKATPLDGMCVCHKCDNPQCVNPEHLFLGTYSDNVQDMIHKGRTNYNIVDGEQNGMHKLTINDVVEIKNGIAQGLTDVVLGRRYSVNYMTIHAIRKGLTWKSVGIGLYK